MAVAAQHGYETSLSRDIADEDIPIFARRCWQRYQDATSELRKAEKQSLGFWIGGEHQWRPKEIASREGSSRPWVSINRCKPAVDQIENEARANPPGPEVHPVGGGSDQYVADIGAGLIREYEYRSNANIARVTALRYAAAGGQGCWELSTEYDGPKSLAQRPVVKMIHDPSTVFYDTDSVLPTREDAMWQGQIVKLGREQLIEQYGDKLKILNRSFFDRIGDAIGAGVGWMSQTDRAKDFASLTDWTGGLSAAGPFYVCKFWRVVIEQRRLTLWTDGLVRADDEEGPARHKPIKGKERYSPQRKIVKHIVTALDHIEKTVWADSKDWQGVTPIIPIFWITGSEIWRDGERYRLSAITGAQDAQRSLNYAGTVINEMLGLMSKIPYTGPEGTFDITNAQGFNPWEASNTQPFAFIEWKPVWTINPLNNQAELLPPPTRNTWEAPIARVMEWFNVCGEQIKAATSVFFEPAQPSAAQVQSGTAIKELQSQTNIGTMNWQASLHQATELEYRQALMIMRQLYDGPRVQAVVRPDETHEMIEINREFPDGAPHSEPGKWKRDDGTIESTNNFEDAVLAVRVTAGPSFQTRTEQAQDSLLSLVKIAPAIVQSPPAIAKLIRIIGEGSPEIEALADIFEPQGQGAQSPEQMQAALQKFQQQNQALTQLVTGLKQALDAKVPEQETKKWIAAVQAIAGIREAEIKAGIDKAQLDLDTLEHVTGMAHEAAMQGVDHAQQQAMGQQQANAASQQSAQDAGQAAQAQAAGAEQEPQE